MSFPAYTLFPDDSPKITDEDFNLYHLFVQKLYSRLIVDLGRDPEQSMQVMGFWMWVETVVCTKIDLVMQLLKLPITVVNEVADESVVCLKCMESEMLPSLDGIFELVLLPKLVHEKISIKLLHEYRLTVTNGVKRRLNEACVRAFKDILQKFVDENFPREVGLSHDFGILNSFATAIRNKSSSCNIDGEGHFNRDGRILPTPNGNKFRSFTYNNVDGRISMASFGNKANCSIGEGGTALQGNQSIIPYPYGTIGYKHGNDFPIFPPREVLYNIPSPGIIDMHQIWPGENVQSRARGQQELQRCELSATFGRLRVTGNIDDILPDDRTIFLTFSKGYPISELQVRNFLTRKFGDFIEALYMQEVAAGEQALYARLVSCSAAVADVVIAGGKAKYIINGRHVWARKYVKKHS